MAAAFVLAISFLKSAKQTTVNKLPGLDRPDLAAFLSTLD
jgi:hypothetical protein